MTKLRTPRDAWIEAAMRALAGGGPDAVRVEALAKELGVSKGGFYWHFEDRRALLKEMLEAWEESGTDEVIARVESEPADPRDKVRRLFELAPSAQGLFAVELALRDWSRRDREVAERLRRIDDRRMAYLRFLFGEFCIDEDDTDARTMLAYSLLVGSYFVAGGQGSRTRGELLQLAIDRLLSEPWN